MYSISMFKRLCDSCGKIVKLDFVSVDFHREKTSGYKHFYVCISCWRRKGIVAILEKRVALVESKIRR